MTEINNYLTTLAKSLIISPEQKVAIEASISALRAKLWAHFQEKLLRIDIFGSYERQTLIPVDDDLDVDILVVFKQTEFKPDTYLNQLRTFAEKNYPRSEVYPDHPSISIEMSRVRFELVPAYPQSGETVKIPAPRTKDIKWLVTSPTVFSSRIIKKDQNNQMMFLPLLRIIRYCNVLNKKALDSYDLEKVLLERDFAYCANLEQYCFSAFSAVNGMAKTEQQKILAARLMEKKRRLKALVDGKLPEYIEQELISFLPMPLKLN